MSKKINILIKLREIVIIIFLSVLFGSASLGMDIISSDSQLITFRMMGISVSLIILIAFFFKGGWRISKSKLLILWFNYSIFAVISEIYNGDPVLGGLWLAVPMMLIFFIILPNVLKYRPNRTINLSLFICHLPYIIISLLKFPIFEPYAGIFANPNSMGILGVTLAAPLFGFLCNLIATKEGMQRIRIFFVITGIAGTFAIILLSASRTSLVAFVLLFCIVTWFVYMVKKLRLLILISIPLGIFIGFIYFLVANDISTYSIILDKFTNAYNGDFLSGRSFIWAETLRQASLLGGGKEYFLNSFELTAHNDFIRVLGENGILSAFFFGLFAIGTLLVSFRYLTLNIKKDPYAITPFLMIVSLWALSMGETMLGLLGNGLSTAAIVLVGICIYPTSNS